MILRPLLPFALAALIIPGLARAQTAPASPAAPAIHAPAANPALPSAP